MFKGVLDQVQFSIASADDIRQMSVLEITNPKPTGPNSVSDPRLGPMIPKPNEKCMTCNLPAIQCAGHWGYITLTEPMIHPLFEKELVKLLRVFCYSCLRLLYTELDTFEQIAKHTDKKLPCSWCGLPQPGWMLQNSQIVMLFDKQEPFEWRPRDLIPQLASFNKDDLQQLGILTEPDRLIIQLLPVLPPCDRPSVLVEDKICDDDLTIQYIEIMKANQQAQKSPTHYSTLMFRIRVLFNNSAGKGKYSTNGKVIKGIKERLSSKQGLMRDNLMGKRVNESGRTVMGPEPTLSIDEIGIPNEMAQILTVPERVTRYNLYKLQALLKTTKISRIWIAETDKVINVKFSTDCIALRIGDVVQRQVMDGDPIVLNRQPTLHRGSLMALRAKLWNGKTLRVNLPITKSFNMDFDGDEGNVHVPQSYLARTELLHLSTPHNLLLSAQNGQANIVLVQDNMLAVYLMTNETHFLKIAYVYDMMLDLVNETGKGWNQHRITERWEHIQSRIDPTSGHGLLSFCLPSTLTWSFENVMIEQGVLVRGVLNKRSVNALLKTIAHVYPSETAVMVINNIVFITNRWLSHRGFTVGLEDCLLHSNQAYDMISSCILKCFTETIAITSTIHHDRVREIRIQEALNRTRDIGMRIAKEGFHPSNNFIQTVSSGSKGDYFNITQISGMLGQQYLKGARIPMRLNNKTRSLYHYPFDIKDELQKYEARGFVRHSFFRGLSPREMYFHAVTGRSGLVDTAMGTSETGYIQRRLVKMMEDITVANDQTIRDDTQQIYQFSFGRHGLKPDGCPLSNLQVLADSLE